MTGYISEFRRHAEQARTEARQARTDHLRDINECRALTWDDAADILAEALT